MTKKTSNKGAYGVNGKVVKRYAIIDQKGNIKNWEDDPESGSAIIRSKQDANKALKETQAMFFHSAYSKGKSSSWEKCKVVEVAISINLSIKV